MKFCTKYCTKDKDKTITLVCVCPVFQPCFGKAIDNHCCFGNKIGICTNYLRLTNCRHELLASTRTIRYYQDPIFFTKYVFVFVLAGKSPS